jgi:isopenicillin N synthase-like dioxygenase
MIVSISLAAARSSVKSTRQALPRRPDAVPPLLRRYSTVQHPSPPTEQSDATSHLSTAGSTKIPIIDFAPFLQSSRSAAVKQEISEQVVLAFKTSGFLYLKNHGLSRQEVARVFQASKSFFALSQAIKDRLAWKDPRANRGYVAQGRERVTNSTDEAEIAALRESAPDYKESLEIGREVDATYKNEWPTEEELPGFREVMLEFRKRADKLHLEVLRSIAIGLNLQADFFDSKCNEEWHTLRLLHYPSIPASLLQGDAGSRAGSHSDYGSLTLLFQDNVGGLQVEDPTSQEYVAAPPIEDTIVVNVGDLLARWSNDTLRSTLHRVVAPDGLAGTGMTPAR